MSLASSTRTECTVWPLMSMPRMSVARACASSGPSATLTPPALPRPPVLTCALTTTLGVPAAANPSAITRASTGVTATLPRGTGTPYSANSSFAWYSNRSTCVRPRSGLITGRSLSGLPPRARAGHREIRPALFVEPMSASRQTTGACNAKPSGSLRDQVLGSGRDTEFLRAAVRLDVPRRGNSRLHLRGYGDGGRVARRHQPAAGRRAAGHLLRGRGRRRRDPEGSRGPRRTAHPARDVGARGHLRAAGRPPGAGSRPGPGPHLTAPAARPGGQEMKGRAGRARSHRL